MIDSQDPSAARSVVRALDDIALLLELSGENAFKVRAYERGARVVEDLGDQLFPFIDDARLTEIEGIGEKLASQITEIARTGASLQLQQLKEKFPPGTLELARIPGLTAKRIRVLHEGLGITSPQELREACRNGRVRTLKGFGAKTETRLLAAVERAAAPPPPQRVLLIAGREIAARIASALLAAGDASAVTVAGALRRCEETLGEIELVVVASDPERVWQRLARMPSVTRIDRESAGARLAQGIGLVLHFADAAAEAAALLRATGPASHVRALEERAGERGKTLDELARGRDEAAVYAELELPPVPPELRGSRDDLDARGYADLIDVADIRGFVHCHTHYSDGRNSIEEMARAAEALGMEYITITDHSPTAQYAHGVTLDRLREQWDEIARVQEQVKIRILRGTESDITAEGSLDYPDDVLERFDVIIASIHARYRMDREKMTERLVRAMRVPVFKIWGHALGRILLHREPFECDVPRVLDVIAEAGGAIEVNADPHRLDLPPQWIPDARARGIPFVISVDAHSTRGLSVLPLGVEVARRGGLRKHEVLNTLPAAQWAQRVRPRR